MKKVIITILILILIMVTFMAYTSYQSLKLAQSLPKYLASNFPVNPETDKLFQKLVKKANKVKVNWSKLPLLGESIEVLPPQYQSILAQTSFQEFHKFVLENVKLDNMEKWQKFYQSNQLATSRKVKFSDVEKMMLLLLIKGRELVGKNDFPNAIETLVRIIKLGADITQGISLDSSILSVSAGSGFISMASEEIIKLKRKKGWREDYLTKYKPFLKMIAQTRPPFSKIAQKSQLYTQQFIQLVLQKMKIQFKILNFFYGDPLKEIKELYQQVNRILNIEEEKEKLAQLKAFTDNYPQLIHHPLTKMVFLNFYKGYLAYQKMNKNLEKLIK